MISISIIDSSAIVARHETVVRAQLDGSREPSDGYGAAESEEGGARKNMQGRSGRTKIATQEENIDEGVVARARWE